MLVAKMYGIGVFLTFVWTMRSFVKLEDTNIVGDVLIAMVFSVIWPVTVIGELGMLV